MATQRQRLVIIGADATGMSAASQARRQRPPEELEIVVFERGDFTSYSACGIPYWIGGAVPERDQLIARTPEEHRARDIDLRMRTEVTALDLDGQRVRTRRYGSATGEDGRDGRDERGDDQTTDEGWTRFDKLVLATGARPVRPPLPGIDAEGVHGVQSLSDGQALLDTLRDLESPSPSGPSSEGTTDDERRRAVVIGAGYIGVEMSEALIQRGYQVTVLDQAEQPMSTLDPDMGALVRDAMCDMGIEVVTEAAVTRIRVDDTGRARAVVAGGTEYPADVVVLGIGVGPETTLAREAGLPLGDAGGLLTDLAMRVRGQRNIWAGGDCVEVLDLVSGRPRHIALGTHANKHGQVIGSNVGGGYATFPGVVGTAVSKVCDLEIARTGLLEGQAERAGLRYITTVIDSTNRAGYYPGATSMRVKMLAEVRTGRLLGVQLVGREGTGKRVDVAAVALTAGMTVEEMTALDLGYAPPFSPVWDPVLVAARKAARAVRERGG